MKLKKNGQMWKEIRIMNTITLSFHMNKMEII